MDLFGHHLTNDQGIALVAGAIALLGTAAGIWAAIFSTRADAATRRAMRDADERHDQEVRPRLEPVGVNAIGYTKADFWMEIANRGGATPLFVFTIQSGKSIYIASGSLDEHTREPFTFQYVGDLSYGTGPFSTPFVVAQDLHERWWDCTLQHFLAGRLIEGSLRKWIDARLAERGLQALLETQMSVRVLDYRSEKLLKQLKRSQSKRRARWPW